MASFETGFMVCLQCSNIFTNSAESVAQSLFCSQCISQSPHDALSSPLPPENASLPIASYESCDFANHYTYSVTSDSVLSAAQNDFFQQQPHSSSNPPNFDAFPLPTIIEEAANHYPYPDASFQLIPQQPPLNMVCCSYCGFCSNDEDKLSKHVLEGCNSQSLRFFSLKQAFQYKAACPYLQSNGTLCETLINTNYKRHLQIHTDDRRYCCQYCDQRFKQKGNLASHQQTCKDVKVAKRYLCGLCGKIFKRKFNLTRHLRGHTGIKPYICNSCGRPFRDRSSLVRHSKICSNSTWSW